MSRLDHDIEGVTPCHTRLRPGSERVVPDRQGGRENGYIYKDQHIFA